MLRVMIVDEESAKREALPKYFMHHIHPAFGRIYFLYTSAQTREASPCHSEILRRVASRNSQPMIKKHE